MKFTDEPNGTMPGWFCLASPEECLAEGPEIGDAAPDECPKCGCPVAVQIADDDEDEDDDF